LTAARNGSGVRCRASRRQQGAADLLLPELDRLEGSVEREPFLALDAGRLDRRRLAVRVEVDAFRDPPPRLIDGSPSGV